MSYNRKFDFVRSNILGEREEKLILSRTNESVVRTMTIRSATIEKK